MRASLVVLVLSGLAHANAFQHVTVQRSTVPDTVIDCYFWQEAPDYNGGGSDTLYTGLVGVSDKMAFIRFDLSPIPQGARIISATLTLEVTGNGGIPIEVHRVTRPWAEMEPTWATFSDAVRPGTPEGAFTPVEGRVSVQLTPLVQSWAAAPATNFGLALSQATMTASSTFRSSDWGVESERPALDVVYDVPPPPAPLISDAPPTLEASCDVPLSYSLRAHAPVGRFTLGSSAGAIDADSGLFTWTPGRGDRGAHAFAIKVDDGARTAELQLAVNVQCSRGLGVGSSCSSAPTLVALLALTWLGRRMRRRA